MPRSSRHGWKIAASVMIGLVTFVFLPPFVPEPIRGHVMDAFAPLCHQIPARSFTVGGIPLAVGHRCTGIYVGLAAGVLMVPWLIPWKETLHRWSPWVLLGLLLVLGVDWIGPFAGTWINTPLSRLAVGLMFGTGAGYYAGVGLAQLFERVLVRR